jgi:histidine ammonia-lyase
MADTTITLDGRSLSLANVEDVARHGARVVIADSVVERMKEARQVVEKIAAEDAPAYGINTGFGALAEEKISSEDLDLLQKNLIVSHAVGVGRPLPFDAARALMLLRANTLAVGHSGCRPVVLENLVQLLNAGCAPHVPSRGSVGASGDLAPLAHLALLLLGEGPAMVDGKRSTATSALEKAGLAPLVLRSKEGLALINGTQAMTSVGILTLLDAERLCLLADVVGAASLDALGGHESQFDARIHLSRPHPGQRESASLLARLVEDSEMRGVGNQVQDPYSLRCMPQVHGATRDALSYARSVLEREINSATDNPLVFLDGDFDKEGTCVVSGGNFHGQPVALALDFLPIAVAELANISERRVEHLVNPALSNGLPPFLAPDAGLNSGFMILQVTAAALVSENKILCHPASVDSIPSSANREDHVSMGMTAANKAREVVDNVRKVLCIELMAACQGLDLRSPLKPGRGIRALHQSFRKHVAFAPVDRAFAPDLEAAENFCRGEEALMRVAQDVGAIALSPPT